MIGPRQSSKSELDLSFIPIFSLCFFLAKKYKSGKAAFHLIRSVRPFVLLCHRGLRRAHASEFCATKRQLVTTPSLILCRADHAGRDGIVIGFVDDDKAAGGMITVIRIPYQRLMHL
ncbi:hypothetical protein SAMN05216386_0323 [Nitrosospira briensis]|uniref:Uncharacterized protein n=1 Tax=Nitrosospira briensis TaxID=35799 RepID=A0A1I4XUV1_9PROT|nr:hypothetical protein SAMN05216386_0323 [Nitrosospira briensis]